MGGAYCSFQFMFVLGGGMVIVVFVDSLKTKLNMCLCVLVLSPFPLSPCVGMLCVCVFCMSDTRTIRERLFCLIHVLPMTLRLESDVKSSPSSGSSISLKHRGSGLRL